MCIAKAVRCPATSRYPGDLAGCGSENVSPPDDEGFHDCCDCGLFFKAVPTFAQPSQCAVRGTP